jgi:F-type H+-transporting ATPase subunit gamma
MAARVDVTSHSLFTVRPAKRVCVVIVSSDRGLCGAFSANILRTSAAHIKTHYPELFSAGNVDCVCIGRKGAEFFQKNEYQVVRKYIGIIGQMVFENARSISDQIAEDFLNGRYDRVDIVYNEFKSIIQQRIVVEQLLPIPPSTVPTPDQDHLPPVNYIYEPSKEDILEVLVPRHLRFQMWHILLESNAAEQGARMSAMDNATTNATDLIRSLQLSYNKARQASITKELLEIVSGAEALKGAD